MAAGDGTGALSIAALLGGEVPSGNATRLFRALARATLKYSLVLTRVELLAALPRGVAAEWLDQHVAPLPIDSGERLYRWGDVETALGGKARTATVATGREYLTTEEAAVYPGHRSASALRMAVSRKLIVPSARRGRTLSFTRAARESTTTREWMTGCLPCPANCARRRRRNLRSSTTARDAVVVEKPR